jgi:hypothetical protein
VSAGLRRLHLSDTISYDGLLLLRLTQLTRLTALRYIDNAFDLVKYSCQEFRWQVRSCSSQCHYRFWKCVSRGQ